MVETSLTKVTDVLKNEITTPLERICHSMRVIKMPMTINNF